MIRIAVLTAAEHDWSHGPNFSQIINGCTEERARTAGMKFIPSSVAPLCDDARVTAIWTPDPARTKVVARALDIPWAMCRSDDAVGKVDAVLSSDDSCEQWEDRNASWAMPYIAAGTPAFLDKPLSHSTREAFEVVDLAREKGAPILSCSGFRFSETVRSQRRNMETLGDIVGADGAGPLGWLIFYGVHVIDPLVSMIGIGAQWVQHTGSPGNHLVVVGYDRARTVCFRSAAMAYGFHFSLYGGDGTARFSIHPDEPEIAQERFHVETVRAAIEMFRTGRMPVSYEEQLEVALILTGAKASMESGGKRIDLSDLRPH
jgi:predicted dehydrogenase